MTPEDFRQHAHTMVDWMADYMRDIGEQPVRRPIEPGAIRAHLPSTPPLAGEAFGDIAADFRSFIVPGMTHWNHPGWFGYFPANNSPPSVLAEMAMATMGAQCMSWETSPAATELEQQVMEWLRQMLGLPTGFSGVIQDTASTATLVALLSARERATANGFGATGASAPHARDLTVYTSREAHSSVHKAVKLAGYGLENLRSIAVDADYAMRADDLEAQIIADLKSGKKPACVVATFGTTSSTAIDPLPAIAALCQRYGLWLHVDAAYAGAAAILPEKRSLLAGVEHADSFVFNPHKWLFTNFDCSAYFVRDVPGLLHTFQTTPEYLKTTHDAAVVNFRDWGIQLGRRFRALKLWFVIRSFGVEGLQQKLRAHIAMAESFRAWVAADARFELMAPSPFGLVCFRLAAQSASDAATDTRNARLLQAINESGRAYLTHTRLGGHYVLRLAVGQLQTTSERVEEVWQLARAAADTA